MPRLHVDACAGLAVPDSVLPHARGSFAVEEQVPARRPVAHVEGGVFPSAERARGRGRRSASLLRGPVGHAGMLSSLHDNLPLRDAADMDMDALLRQMDGYLADSVIKKRRKKMNKHKHRKRKKALHRRLLTLQMLKKLASPKKRAASSRAARVGREVSGEEEEREETPKEPKPKPPKEKKEKANKPDAASLEAPSDEAKEAGNVVDSETKAPSPRKSIGRKFRLFDPDTAPEDKKPLTSPKKKLMKLPKPEKKSKLVDKNREAKSHDEALEPSADREKVPLTPSKSDAAESPKRKTRWKIPDMKHHKTSNNQKELLESIHKDPESSKAPLSPTIDSSSGSEQENQTNVLSPLRRHKPESDDTLPIPESPYNTYRLQQRRAQLDVPPAFQPEVHLIGEIVSGHGFEAAGGLTCKWRVECGSRWSLIAGDQFGQTQLDYPSTAPWTSDPDVAVWSHPIDLHFATSAFQGWPKLLFQVWRADSNMKLHVVGYGFVSVPFAAGQHKLWVSLWRPLGSTMEELDVQLLGRTPELKSDDVLFNAAWSERCRLRTVSTGRVLVHIGVLLRHFHAGVIEA
ncbi:protein of unknown function DUF1713, mitochondria [Phytophthora cactorum]|nr:protein of unknown function DUF1713, mitochondria [Phytophthora cactorum]